MAGARPVNIMHASRSIETQCRVCGATAASKYDLHVVPDVGCVLCVRAEVERRAEVLGDVRRQPDKPPGLSPCLAHRDAC
jgi:hypothetical protein